MNNDISIFEERGGEFVSSPFLFKEKLAHVKAVLFDWDGVFHSGYKQEHRTSAFSEADSMGVNMLRFGLFLQENKLPVCGIITGEHNPTAAFWSSREHLDFLIEGAKDKRQVLAMLDSKYGIKPHEVAFVFDDILDLSLAREVGVRMLVTKNANPKLINYAKQHKLADYITYSDGGNHAVREVSEVLLTLLDRFDETVTERMEFSSTYRSYLEKRQDIETQNLGSKDLP